MLTRFLFLCLVFPLVALGQPRSKSKVIVYGATAGGVMAAVAAAREGASVQLVEPGRHLGGMLTGGLSHTDYGDRAVIGGLALEFYERVAKAYHKPLYFWRGPEPHLGEQWISLGTYPFRQGRAGSLTLSNEGADGTVAADAFKFERVK